MSNHPLSEKLLRWAEHHAANNRGRPPGVLTPKGQISGRDGIIDREKGHIDFEETLREIADELDRLHELTSAPGDEEVAGMLKRLDGAVERLSLEDHSYYSVTCYEATSLIRRLLATLGETEGRALPKDIPGAHLVLWANAATVASHDYALQPEKGPQNLSVFLNELAQWLKQTRPIAEAIAETARAEGTEVIAGQQPGTDEP